MSYHFPGKNSTQLANTGKYEGCREYHVGPDWLLIYEVVDGVLVLMFYRFGKSF
ncbi:MAG: type II toxin-antitoxin system mRNA interferase toxin, RelE/StbE family [Lachnospiraceae bacterium]|nr:type II toxin-antitoxin system mRNA interferase toxin, RelE/StbE family [Lachnospiraceae bacterium]